MTDTRFVRCNECEALNEPRAVFCSRCGAALPDPTHGNPTPRFHRSSMALGAALILGLLIIAFVLYSVVARSLDKGADVAIYVGQKGVAATILTSTTTQADANGVTVTSATLPTDASVVTTTTEPPIIIRPKATVSSSALEGTSTASFQATNLVDSDLKTAWIEGAKGTGVGEWVRFDFSQPVVLARIEVLNGYQKDDVRFSANPRVRLVNVEFSSGANYLVELHDLKDLQIINPPTEAIDWVRIVIVSVYPGGDNQDTALSEVHLLEKAD